MILKSKTSFLSLLFFGAVVHIMLSSHSNGQATGYNTDNTGSPLSTQLCSNCHSGGAFGTVSVSIQVFQLGTTNLVSSYVGGTTYDMRVSISTTSGTPGGYGFQMTALTSPGNAALAGYTNLATNVKQKTITTGTFNGRTYVEHNGVSASNQFNFRWTAPAAGTGAVKFYASGNSVNATGGSGGDRAANTSLTLPEQLPLAVSSIIGQPACAGQNSGSIQLTVTGGTAPYSFLWNDGSTLEDRTNLAEGNYNVTVTDAALSSQQLNFVLDAPNPIVAEVIYDNPIIPNGSTEVSFVISGGTGPFQIQVNGQPFQNPSMLSAGEYNYTITDANGCQSMGSFNITSPAELMINVVKQNIDCYGEMNGMLAVTAQGATPPYQYFINGMETATLSDLGPGIYDIEVIDAVGYSQSTTAEILESPQLIPTITYDPILCYGQSTIVTISAEGGNAPYSGTGLFELEAGTFFLQVIDDNGCEVIQEITITQPDSLIVFANNDAIACSNDTAYVEVMAMGGVEPYAGVGVQEILNPGVYTYIVTDANGCSAQTVSSIEAIDGPSVAATITNPICYNDCNGSIELMIEGESQNYTVVWSDGSTDLIRTDLCAGQYSAIIQADGGCSLALNYLLTNPDSLQVTISSGEILCFGGNTYLQVFTDNAMEPIEYTWSNSLTGSNIGVNAGTYAVDVIDGNGCAGFAEVTVTQPPNVNIEYIIQNVTCNGGSDGQFEAIVSGATPPFTFNWITGDQDFVVTDIGAGDFIGQITDENGCIFWGNVSITEPDPLMVEVISFEQNSNGTALASVSASGGTAPYAYQWSNGATGDTQILMEGSHTVDVIDANGCVITSNAFFVASDIDEAILGDVSLYPNPSNDFFHFNGVEKGATWQAYAMDGRQLASGLFEGEQSLIDAREWAEGAYVVHIIQSRQQTTHLMRKQ